MDGYLVTQLLHAAAKLGIADLLADEPRTPEEIAAAVGIGAAPLRRVLRGLAVEDVLEERADGRFALTALGAGLRDGAPGRAAAIARGELYWGAAGGLLDALRAGGAASDPASEAAFAASMADRAAREAADAVAAYDFATLGSLVAVGGDETLVAAIARVAPALVAAEADALPHGADAYLLPRVLHHARDDAKALRILAACRAAMADDARLLLVEAVLPEHASALPAAIRADLHMLILFGARERTASEYRALLAEAGLAILAIHPTRSPVGLAVIEAAFWR